jgi:penicillin-binding protein 1A
LSCLIAAERFLVKVRMLKVLAGWSSSLGADVRWRIGKFRSHVGSLSPTVINYDGVFCELYGVEGMRLVTNKYLNYGIWVVITGFIGGLGGALGVTSVIMASVWFGDNSHLKKTTIMARINEETTVYCLDEQTPIGSFFNSEHRRYVSIDEVPKHMVNALVAAEDKNFFSHGGVDPQAIFKAFLEGFRTGKFRGGSTLTQQTVKNIMDRWEYSLARKLNEAIAALQLEKLYSKQQILEFYLNQFHVSGNGSGIGIAAKYYFNKEVKDLEVVESAFIAGSVKGPSKYDPYLKYTKERREQAVKNAFDRKNYVLRRMYEQGWLSEAEFKDAFERPVPFNRGSFRSSEVALVSLIRNQVGQKEVMDNLGIESIEELNNAGLKIYTTIDCKLQEKAQLGMRRNLSRLETILGGFQPEKPENFRRLRDLEVNQFYYGKVEDIRNIGRKDPEIHVSFGLSTGIVPSEAILRYAKLLDGPYMEGTEVQMKKFLHSLKRGDVIFAEVKAYDAEKHEAVLEMQKSPRVNGGLVALDKGEVRVAVSGFDTIGFNRAIFARRQPGSVFKSVVYYAAMQLGWNILDIVDNERQIFPYQARFYFPRPDHISPYRNVSMVWSGAMSENLASVGLANRLVDKLNFDQFKDLMSKMDLAPHPSESAPDFHFRVAKTTGVQLDNDGVKEYQLQRAISDVVPDLVFQGSNESIKALEKMWWGKGYIGELQSLYARQGSSDMPPLENALRINLVKNNFLRMKILAGMAETEFEAIAAKVQAKGADGALADAALKDAWNHFRVLPTQGNKPALGFLPALDGELPRTVTERFQYIDRLATIQGRSLNALDVEAIWASDMVTKSEIRLNGTLPLGEFSRLEKAVEEHYQAVMSAATPYDLNRYFEHHDFRIALGLNYLVEMVKAMGVTSKVDPVQSFPLGTNDVTAAEVAKIYQTFVEGKIYRFYEKGPANQINFIRRILDRHGEVVFEPKRQEATVAIPEYSDQMHEILKRVVTHGTGRRARGELYLDLAQPADGAATMPANSTPEESRKVRIQAFGKTGTTNDYTNAYFAGFFPVPPAKGAPLDFSHFHSIASYVGYDLNKMMRRGAIKVSGAIGALPTWIDYAKGMMETMKYRDQIDELDLSIAKRGEWPMKYDARNVGLGVDLARGVVFSGGDGGEEVFATTNIEKTGESFESEFAIGSTVKSVIRVPGDGRGGVARLYSPFNFQAELKESSLPAAPAKVEVSDKAATAPDVGTGPANAQLLPGVKPGDLSKEPQDILDDEGLVIKGDEVGATKKDEQAPPVTNDDPSVDVNGQQKPEPEKSNKRDPGDVW